MAGFDVNLDERETRTIRDALTLLWKDRKNEDYQVIHSQTEDELEDILSKIESHLDKHDSYKSQKGGKK